MVEDKRPGRLYSNTLKKADTAINCAKRILIAKAKSEGLYENFGSEEVRQIKDKFVDLSDYSDEMNLIRTKIANFEQWCMEYMN